jgi:hypothetical protein
MKAVDHPVGNESKIAKRVRGPTWEKRLSVIEGGKSKVDIMYDWQGLGQSTVACRKRPGIAQVGYQWQRW